MPKFLFMFLFLALSGMICSKVSLGQDSQDVEGSLLPEIDPQDIEIRSQYRARFPGLRRQPILGFSPTSRVYQVDPGRVPFLEDLDEIAAQLPVGELTRPEAPEYDFFPYASRQTGFLQAGIGSHFSPEADLYLNQEVAESHWISGSVNHQSGDGHLEQPSSFRNLGLDARYRGKLGRRTVMGVSVDAVNDFHYHPLPAAMFPQERPGRKDLSGLSTAVRVQHHANAIEHLDVGVEAARNTIGLDENLYDLSAETGEWMFGADAGYTWAGERINETIHLNSDLQLGAYEWMSGESQSWHRAGIHGGYRRLFNYQTRLQLNMGLYHTKDAFGESVHLAPDFSVEHYPSDFFTISARITGKPEQGTVLDHHQYNRYLMPDTFLRHSYHLKARTELVLEPIADNKIRAGISYQSSQNYPVYQNLDLNVLTLPGHYVVEYEDVTIPRIFAGMSVHLIRERLWFDVEGYIQNARISSERNLPFEEDYGLDGAMTLRPVDPLLVEVWGNFTGPRETPDEGELDPFLYLGGKVELKITSRIGVYGKIENLLNQSYELWEGYEERPLQVFGGVTVTF